MAKIRDEDIDALREHADFVEIVSGYSRLKKSGTHTYKGLCPFHSEKTPSFTLDAARALFFCFGCGEGGNIYHFVQKVENLSFPEAVEWLARKTGFQLHYEEMQPGEATRAGTKARLIQANQAAADFFHNALLSSPDADAARTYLAGRGFGRDVAARWLLGYAPGRDALCKHLLSRSFRPQEILQADLARRSERDGSLYDTFRQRIIFPTWNLQGDVAGFGARALGDQQPKYLNTADNPVFHKSRIMYGLDRAKSAITHSVAIVVEGYTDVIALHEAGIREAVATNGVAVGEGHFELLKKFTPRVVLMLDADQAGKGATERSFGVHHRVGVEILVAPLPAGRDPAEVVREDGSEGIRKVVDAAKPLIQFKLEELIAKAVLDTPEARARAVREVAKVLRWHPDPIARSGYVFMAAERIGVDAAAIERALSEEHGTAFEAAPSPTKGSEERRLPGQVKVEREALKLLLVRPLDATEWVGELSESDFTSNARRELFRELRSALSNGGRSASPDISRRLSGEALSLFTELTVGADVKTQPGGSEHSADEVFVRLKVFGLEREIKARRHVLEGINPLEDPKRHDALFTELVHLEAQRRDLLKRLQGPS